MIGLLSAGLVTGIGFVTWMHLRRSSRGRAEPFPSLQLLEGTSPRRRPERRVDEPIRWGLRTLALVSIAAALYLARSVDFRPGLAILVDPAAGPAGLAVGRRVLADSPTSSRGVLFSFENGRAVAETKETGSDQVADSRQRLASCGATEIECLWRVAGENAPIVVLSPFEAIAWRTSISASPHPFFYRRISSAAPVAPVAVPEHPEPLPACRVDHPGDSAETRTWAAALTAVTRRPESGGCAIRVGPGADTTAVSGATGESRLLVASDASSETDALPAVTGRLCPTVRLADDLAPIAGSRALRLDASLAFQTDRRFESVLSPILDRRIGSGPPVLAAAASADDLGRWANDGTLLALARIVALEACRDEPFPSVIEPLPTTAGWIDVLTRGAAPVGLLDVPPGEYLRNDRRLLLDRWRDVDERSSGTSDAFLATLGGRNQLPPERASNRSILILVLLGFAVLLRLADIPRRRAILTTTAYLAGLTIVAIWILDVPIPSRTRRVFTARAAGRFSLAEKSALAAALQHAGIDLAAGDSAADAGTVAVAGRESAAPVDALLFPAALPRVDLLSIEYPDEIRVGEAGEVRLVIEARRAAGRILRARARADNGSAGSSSVKIEGGLAVVPISLTVTPATAGVSLAAVDVGFPDSPASDPDGAVFAVVARPGRRKFLVASTSPNWDARAAAGALAASGIDVASLTELGKTAVVARNAPPEDPNMALARAGALDHVDGVVLAGSEPLAESARRRLDLFVSTGGGLMILGAVPGAPGLTARGRLPPNSAVDLPAQVIGTWGGQSFEFSGFPSPPLALSAGDQVLARLKEPGRDADRPWIVGRGFGHGRVVQVLAPDLWRLGGPGSSQNEAYSSLIRGIVGWLLAGRRPSTRIRLAEDLATLVVDRDGHRSRVDPASGGDSDGLGIDARDPLSAAPNERTRQRALARRRGRRLVEVDSARELSEIWKRLPKPESRNRRIAARRDDLVAAAFLMAFLFEVFLRRRAPADRGSNERPSRPAQV